MFNNNKTAVYSKPFFRSSSVRGQTVPGFDGKVTYGGAIEAAGECTHSDRASGYDNLTVVVSGAMTLLDCVGAALVAFVLCMMTYVVCTFSLVLVGASAGSVELFGSVRLVFQLMTISIRRIVDLLGFLEKLFVAEPFTIDNFLTITISRIISVVLSEVFVPKSTRELGVWLKLVLVVASSLTIAYFVYASKLISVTLMLQVLLMTSADIGVYRNAGAAYAAALSTTIFHPLFVGLVTLVCVRARWIVVAGNRYVNGASGTGRYWFSLNRFGDKSVGEKNGGASSKQQRMDKNSRELVKELSRATGLYAPRIYDYATVTQWKSFGRVGVPSDMDRCLRGIALYGDREMASMLARVGLRQQWDVELCSNMSQRLLTNAAFAKYFDVKLAKLFPNMVSASEKKKGTFVEALVGAAVMEPGSNGAIERFVLEGVRGVCGE